MSKRLYVHYTRPVLTTPGPYVGFPWQVIGGDPAIDLVNTVAHRLDPERTVDRLVDPAHLADWLAVVAGRYGWQVDVSPEQLSGKAGGRVLGWTRRVREATAELLDAHLASRTLPEPALRIVRRAGERARVRALIEPGLPVRPRFVAAGADDVPIVLGLAVERLCARANLDALRRCAAEDCGWFFLDTSKNSSRRWCDPGDCGNRARVRAFATRRRLQRAGQRRTPAASSLADVKAATR
jgi:predicted RNA-binding Zn ribbon-like protein